MLKPIDSTFYDLRGCRLYGGTDGQMIHVELRSGSRVLGTFKLDPFQMAAGNWEAMDYSDLYAWAEKLAADEFAKECNAGRRGDQLS